MHSVFSKSMGRVAALAVAALLPVALVAQETAKPAPKVAAGDQPSKWDIFAGYSYLAPKGTVNVPQGTGATTLPYNYDAVNVGGLISGAYYFNRYVGAQVELGIHEYGEEKSGSTVGTQGNNDGFLTAAGGLIVRYPTSDITPFVHALVGGARIDGPDHNPFTWGPHLTVGGGLDYATPLFNHRLAVRVFQVDYNYMHADFGQGNNGGRANINAARLSAGVVWHVGTVAPPPQATLSCAVSPASVFPGEPVTVTATAGSLHPKLNVIYAWEGQGVSGKDNVGTVNTAALEPGTYTIKATVKEGKAGKEGLQPWQTASCTSTVTVKAFEPPTISCSANPSTIKPGETSEVSARGVSPQNRPLTYSYSASAGSINGSGTTASYSSTGAPTGAVAITCKVADDKGHTATADTSVTVIAPVPPAPHTQALCALGFSKDKVRPTRVDNEAKACLDEVALSLQKQSDAKLVIVGEKNSKEQAKLAKEQKAAAKSKHAKVVDPAAERAVNAKAYLTGEKGIDSARVSVATGSTLGESAENYLVPSGANFSSDVQGTTAINESAVKAQPRKALGKKHAKKAAK